MQVSIVVFKVPCSPMLFKRSPLLFKVELSEVHPNVFIGMSAFVSLV
jgi:hypothetical protein